MADLTITYSSQDIIKEYDLVGSHFMKKILDMDYHTMALSDESWLSDFSGCGLKDEQFKSISTIYNNSDKTGMKYSSSKKLYYKIQYDFWKKWVISKIKDIYNLEIEFINKPIYELFETIQNSYDKEKMQHEVEAFVFIEEEHEPIAIFKKRPETPEEISQALETTLNPFFYARHKKITVKEATLLMEQRQDERFGLFKPYDD